MQHHTDHNHLLVLAEHYFHNDNYLIAEEILNLIIKIDPINSKANELLAYIFGNKGNFDTCHVLLEKSCESNGCSAEALYHLGTSHLKKRQYEKAVSFLKQSLQKNGVFFEALHNLGTVYGHLGKTEEALSCYLECVNFVKNSYELYFNIARCFDNLKSYEEALSYYDRSIQIKPDYAQAWSNKGVTLNDLRRYDEALRHFDRAIQLKPDYAEAWSNKGVTLHDLKLYDESLSHFDKAIQLKPEYYQSYWNKSSSLLSLGDFRNGWHMYSFRWRKDNPDQYRHGKVTELKSVDNLLGKTILVWHEQGYGDTIQFSRYIKNLIELGANVTFEVQKDLLKLFKTCTNSSLKCDVKNYQSFDFQVPLLTLPKLFNTEIDTIPKPTSIKLASEDILRWKKILNLSNEKMNIGLAVSGNPKHLNDLNRSMSLIDASPLLKHGKFYLIQKELKNNGDIEPSENLIFLGDQLSDFTDTAAIIMNMDLIISVDTSLIHLAGSLNKQSFLMLPWRPEWRWLIGRSDSPWYPSIKIFRQKSLGDWNSVVRCIEKELLKGSFRNEVQRLNS